MADERTLISDVVVPEIYEGYTSVNTPEKTALFESGIIIRDPFYDAKASQGGRIVHLPFWKDIDASVEPTYSDDSMTAMEPAKIVADEMIARVAYLNHALRSPDLIKELAGSDPMQHIRNRFGVYWQRQYQRRLLAILEGLYNDNVAANSSDMVKDISGTNAQTTAGSTLITAEAILDALGTSAEYQDDYRAMLVHPIVYTRLKKENLIDFIPDSQGQLTIPTYMGMRVVVDTLWTTAAAGSADGDAAKKYFTVFFGAAAFAYGEGAPRVPVEIDREARLGNGGGMEVLIERKTMLIHPFGYEFSSSSVTGQSPTWTNLKNAANWVRVVDRKNLPLAFLVTNG